MQACGWEVEGVDFDPKAVEQARDKHGLTMYAGELREVAYAQDAFDAITLNHVIEHLPEPIEVLTECRRILRPGGHLVVITPNVNSWGRRRFTSHWRGLEPPRHLFLFSPHTLAAVATKVGFDDFQVFSRAGGATPYMLKTSLETERLNQHPSTAGLLNKGLILSLYEKLLMFKYPDWGEEAVLLAIK
jgi:SAM-dependent methyltransferase